MRLFQPLLLALALCGFTHAAVAAPAAPKNGVEYKTLAQAQNTDAGAKVEVIEFFSYTCPHCHSFDPILTEWVRKNADKVAFKRVHVGHGEIDAALQRAYLTFEAMGITEQVHPKVFAALHVERERLVDNGSIVAWLPKAGVATDKYIAVTNSFGIRARLNRAREQLQAYQIEEWPMIAIGGRYLTSPYLAASAMRTGPNEAQQQVAALQVMDHLVAKARAENK